LSLLVVESIGFSPVYAACAIIPLLAGLCLLDGVYFQTGSVDPRTATISGD